MHININLLPRARRLSKWHYGRLLLTPAVIVLAIIGMVYAYGEYRLAEMDQQITQVRSQYESLSAAEQWMKISQNRSATVQAREKILLQLSGGRISWYAAMTHLGTYMPRRIWLTEIGSAQKGILQMKGNALTYPELVDFLAKMEQDKTLGEPMLLKAEQNEKESLTKFEITARIGRQ